MQDSKASPRLWARDIADRARFHGAPPAQRQEIQATQIRVFYELSYLGVFVSLFVAALGALGLYERVPGRLLWPWLGAVLAVAVLRFTLSWRFHRARIDDAHMIGWGRLAWIGCLAQGLVWATLPFVVAAAGRPAEIYIAIFIATGLAFGSYATLGFYLPAYLGFSVPILAGLVLWVELEVPEVSGWLVALLVVATAALTQAGVRASRVLRGAMLLTREREDWLHEVTAEKERVQVTLAAIGDGVISTSLDGRVAYLNHTAEVLTGWRSADAEGQPLSTVLRFEQGETDLVAECLSRGEAVSLAGERKLIPRGGARRPSVQLKVSPIRDGERGAAGVVVVLRDVTELSGLAEAISYQARHDSLTGLLNRKSFERAVADAMEYSRHHGATHAVCYLDLDQFKVVNDSCGHAAGDDLLKQIAERLRRRVRESDVIARLGGDEFGVLLYRCPPDKAKAIADDFAAIVREFRFTWEDKAFSLGVSVGLVPFDGEGSAVQVLAAADAACYVAKEQGRNRVHIAFPGDAEVEYRHGEMRQISLIQRALDDDLFRLRFQRIVPLRGDDPIKAEFLVSMATPEGELLAPGQFLPAAERFNMMPKLDRHITRLVFRYAADDHADLAGIDAFTINLSGQTLADEDFLDYVVALLRDSGVPPGRICFEITETAVIANLDRALKLIQRLRAEGCRFALDDFGSGLSSFGYLRNLPVDYLKIDGQFVKNMCDDRINRSIVEAINQVGHIMGIKTIAEFVEDERTRDALRALGVDYGQGWGIHKPALLAPLG